MNMGNIPVTNFCQQKLSKVKFSQMKHDKNFVIANFHGLHDIEKTRHNFGAKT